MAGFIGRKVGAALIVVFLASVVVFAGVRALPGDPALALAAEDRDPKVLAAIRDKYGLDDPLPVQYVRWAGLALRGDLGTDSRGLPVSETIMTRIPLTLELAGLALLIGALVGIPAGVIAAVRRGKASDYAATTVALLGLSVPHFWLGLMMIIVFAVNLGWLPAGGYVPFREDPIGNLEHMLMPAIVLGTGLSAVLMRQMRSAMLTSLGADYVRTARAKGLSERAVVGKHALRNSLIPVVTFIGADVGALMGGAIVTEGIFNIPGIGRAVFDSIRSQEGAVTVGITVLLVGVFIFFNLLVDVLYAVLDPRIRYD
jgi:peptide/nickel transport system permease protein